MIWLLIVPAVVLVLFVVAAALSQGNIDVTPAPPVVRPTLTMSTTDARDMGVAVRENGQSAATSAASSASGGQLGLPASWTEVRHDVLALWNRCAELAGSDPAQLSLMSADLHALIESLANATARQPAPEGPTEVAPGSPKDPPTVSDAA